MTYGDENVQLIAIPTPWDFLLIYPADGSAVAELRINPKSLLTHGEIAQQLHIVARILESGTATHKTSG